MKVDIHSFEKTVVSSILAPYIKQYKVPLTIAVWALPKLQMLVDSTWNKYHESKTSGVTIHTKDIYDMDISLGKITKAMLIKFKAELWLTENTFVVDNSDIPSDCYAETREDKCVYVLDRMIESYTLHLARSQWEPALFSGGNMLLLTERNKYIQEGFILFGKYYTDLWITGDPNIRPSAKEIEDEEEGSNLEVQGC